MKRMKKWMNVLLDLAFVGICLILLWFAAQVFWFASFRIPSDSMSPTLREGDCVWVWKPMIGARIFNLHKSLNLEQTEIYRLPGIRKIRRNDVVVFNFPYPNDWNRLEMHILKYYIKRCIGIPGDTLFIDKGVYRVKGTYQELGNIDSQYRIMEMRPEEFSPGAYKSFPYDSLLNWNIQDFGPLYIPKVGDEVRMDFRNGVLYRKLIEWEQGKELGIRGDTVLLNDSVIASYRFRKDYYFVAGDHGENSQDSRYWGLLPEEYIVGVATRIWKSVDRYTGKIDWDRVWKEIK